MKWQVFALAVLTTAATAGTTSAGQQPQPGAAERKVDNLTRDIVALLTREHVDEKNAMSLDVARRFSTPSIKVDGRARIQLYIELTTVTPEHVAVVKKTGAADVELSNTQLKLIQAWVPYRRIESLAALDFVTRIRPPSYAVKRTSQPRRKGPHGNNR